MLHSSKLSNSKRRELSKKRFPHSLRPHLEALLLQCKNGRLLVSIKSLHLSPPLQAQRPDYASQTEQRWSHPATYDLEPHTIRTGTDYHQEMEQANLAHLEAAARIEDQWNRERREQAEREWKEHEEAATKRWEAQMREAGSCPTERIPAGPPPVAPQSETRPRALPEVHGALRASDPQVPKTQPTVAKKPPPSTGKPIPAGFYRGDAHSK